MDIQDATHFTMPLKIPQLLDIGPLTLAPARKRGPQVSVSESPPLYPPSSDSESPSDSEDSYDSDAPPPPSGLRTSVAALPDTKLRRIMVKLADSNPQFHRAIMKELACAQKFTGDSLDSPPNTPTNASRTMIPRRRKRRSQAKVDEYQRNHKNLSVTTTGHACAHQASRIILSDELSPEEYVFHPGHLDAEVYEFLSPSAESHDTSFESMRTVTMWTCCDEDEWSPGCVSVPSFAEHTHRERDAEAYIQLAASRALSDSDPEHRYESETNARYRTSRTPDIMRASPGHGHRSG